MSKTTVLLRILLERLKQTLLPKLQERQGSLVIGPELKPNLLLKCRRSATDIWQG